MNIRLAYCDYIAHIIQKNLLVNDEQKLLNDVGRIQYDLTASGEFDSTTKTIDVIDMQDKQYRIIIQEL
jgi:hypothetical protein